MKEKTGTLKSATIHRLHHEYEPIYFRIKHFTRNRILIATWYCLMSDFLKNGEISEENHDLSTGGMESIVHFWASNLFQLMACFDCIVVMFGARARSRSRPRMCWVFFFGTILFIHRSKCIRQENHELFAPYYRMLYYPALKLNWWKCSHVLKIEMVSLNRFRETFSFRMDMAHAFKNDLCAFQRVLWH